MMSVMTLVTVMTYFCLEENLPVENSDFPDRYTKNTHAENNHLESAKKKENIVAWNFIYLNETGK